MVRPRLVEEGKPIAAFSSEERKTNAGHEDDAMAEESATASPAGPSSTGGPVKRSSLQAAAVDVASHPPHHRRHRHGHHRPHHQQPQPPLPQHQQQQQPSSFATSYSAATSSQHHHDGRVHEHTKHVEIGGAAGEQSRPFYEYSAPPSSSLQPPASQHLLQPPPMPHEHAQHFEIGGTAASDAIPSFASMHTMTTEMNQHHHQPPSIHVHEQHFEIGGASYSQAQAYSAAQVVPPSSVIQAPQRPVPSATPHVHETHFEIGADTRPVQRMEGVQDLSDKPALVVLDGANVAYSYGQASMDYHSTQKPEPDTKGIQVACQYFERAGLRVLVVLPASWVRSKPRPGDRSATSNVTMQTEQMDAIENLQRRGLILQAPPTDDDDAYALIVAQRENQRRRQNQNRQIGPGYVLSNDLFRDAQARDHTGSLKEWLVHGHNGVGPGRISFAFCDMGALDDHGDRQLDIVPNPRHPLISWIEHQQPQEDDL